MPVVPSGCDQQTREKIEYKKLGGTFISEMETFITGNVMGLSPALGGVADINRHIVFPNAKQRGA